MNEAELHALLERYGGVLHGHFKLSSGRHSDTFLQTALVTKHPHIAERLGHELGSRFADAGATVVLVLSIVDREEGAAEFYRQKGIPFEWFFQAREFKAAH